jgi:phosphatidylglycerol---prolipoprotein diacylglyceryl transferase
MGITIGGAGISIGRFTIYYYGIIIMIGVIAAAFLASHEARRKGANSELVWDGLVWVLIGGIIGARLWHIFAPPASQEAIGITTQFYLTHPLDAINIRAGGLGIPGGIIGGVIALYFFTRRHKLSFPFWLDVAAPAVALAQAIGRWGNYFNQEVYGLPTNLPWKIFIDPQNRLPGYESQAYYHPIFLYESIWSLVTLFVLLWVGRRYKHWLKEGDVFLIYLIMYPFGRFMLEFLRLDPAKIGIININQIIMLIVALASAGFLFWRHRSIPEHAD